MIFPHPPSLPSEFSCGAQRSSSSYCYWIDSHGVIHQKNPHPITYNPEYINTNYCTYPERCRQMSYLRLGYLLGTLGFIPNKLMDFGYGAGYFLEAARSIIPDCHGYDITGLTVPERVRQVTEPFKEAYDVICLFDVLEHILQPEELLRSLQCRYLFMSVPWCHAQNPQELERWKHFKPNEHIHHFNAQSLTKFVESLGFQTLRIEHLEDTIRQPLQSNHPQQHPNILSAIFIGAN